MGSTERTVLLMASRGFCGMVVEVEEPAGSVSSESAVAVLSMVPSPPPLVSMSFWVSV